MDDNVLRIDIDKALTIQQRAWADQKQFVLQQSAFHQQLWADLSIPSNLLDLPELPLVDKAMLRQSQAQYPPFGNYLAASKNRVNRLHRTSGTTGQAMNLALSAKDCEITEIIGGRCQRAAGLGESPQQALPAISCTRQRQR